MEALWLFVQQDKAFRALGQDVVVESHMPSHLHEAFELVWTIVADPRLSFLLDGLIEVREEEIDLLLTALLDGIRRMLLVVTAVLFDTVFH